MKPVKTRLSYFSAEPICAAVAMLSIIYIYFPGLTTCADHDESHYPTIVIYLDTVLPSQNGIRT